MPAPEARLPYLDTGLVVTIALGIGAATAVFSLVYAILLRPFPYPDADRLVRVFTVAEGEQGAERNCSLLDIEEYNRRSSLLDNIGGYTVFDSQIEGDGLAEAVVIAQLNQEAMHAVGVQPVLGRLFSEEEDRKGGPVNKALLGHGLWQRRYGGAPDALGKMIRLPMGEFEVVGVMPAGYGYPDRATLWLTMESWYALGLDSYREKQRDQRWYATVARLAPGVSLEQAQDEMGAVARQLATEFPTTNQDVGVRLVPLRDAEVGEVRPYLMLLAGGVSLVLLICIFNVANLLFARALTQHKQYVLQAALGAGRFELTKGFLAESLLLASVGGAGGAAIAWVAVRGFQTLLPDSLPMWMRIAVDPHVLAFCFAATVISGFALGVAPAVMGSRVNLTEALNDGTRGSAGDSWARSALVVTEVAASLLLLLGAGLLMKTFVQMQNADHGRVLVLLRDRCSNCPRYRGLVQMRAQDCFGPRAGHRHPVGARGNASGRAGHGRSTRNGVGPARTRDRLGAFGGSSPNDRSLVGRCCGFRLGNLRVGGRLSGGGRTPGVAMAGRSRFAARPRAVTEERIDEAHGSSGSTTGASRRWADPELRPRLFRRPAKTHYRPPAPRLSRLASNAYAPVVPAGSCRQSPSPT